LIINVSAGGAGEDLIINVNLSPACSALKDISALSGRPPDWIVKCQSGFNGSLQHDSLRSPIPVAFGLGEALTVGAKCSVMASCGDFGRLPESMIKMSYWLNRDLSMQYHDSWKKMFAFSFGDGEALTGGAKCSWMAVSLQAKSGDFGRPPDSDDFGSQCHHQSLGWSVNPYPGLQASICSVSDGVTDSIVKCRSCHNVFGRALELQQTSRADHEIEVELQIVGALVSCRQLIVSWTFPICHDLHHPTLEKTSRSLVLFGTMSTVSFAGLESTCFSWASIGK
jgi:hypothetical protein